MKKGKADIKDPTLLVDINEATVAVKENRFADALKVLEINLSRYPDHIDSLYLAGVSARYLKKFDDSKKYIETLLRHAPDMGRAYQELGHLNKSNGNIDIAISHYRHCLLYTSPSPRDRTRSRMPSSA